ncbi:MAG: hypothetical protein KBD66_02850 [Candidatus Doudnabacteria bacterium]|nr:hypothetical protein [Candidatus Doudnabacteria bacterium]
MPERSFFVPILMLVCAWVLQVTVLAAWFGAAYAPNLVLCVLLVFAVTDADLRYFWLSVVTALFLDLQNRLVIGSFSLAVPLCYVFVAALSRQILRSDRIYITLPVLYFVVRLFLHGWIYFVGFVAGFMGYELRPLFSFRQEFVWVGSSIVGAGLTVVVYFFWLELLHRLDRPIRLR